MNRIDSFRNEELIIYLSIPNSVRVIMRNIGDVYDFMLFFNTYLYEIDLSVTKIAGEYNLLIIFLNQDYAEKDE
jgi:hypothetical protein